MAAILDDGAAKRLERSCSGSSQDWLRRAPAEPVFERFEAFFTGHAYDPHRHDRYAIGYTLSGVQLFRYRGAQADSRRGNALVIHPDELHDGHAGRNAGFCYRMLMSSLTRSGKPCGEWPTPCPSCRGAYWTTIV